MGPALRPLSRPTAATEAVPNKNNLKLNFLIIYINILTFNVNRKTKFD